MFLRRRRLIATTGLAAASLGLPRIAIGQADQRPSITIAVQQIANSASLGARPHWDSNLLLASLIALRLAMAERQIVAWRRR